MTRSRVLLRRRGRRCSGERCVASFGRGGQPVMPVAGAGEGAPRLSHLRIPRSTAPGSGAPRPGPRRPGNGTGGSPGAGPTGSPETREMPESAIAGGMRSAAIAGGCRVAAVGLVVMAGWVTGVAVLTSVLPTPGRIFFNTAFGLTLGGSSIALAARDLAGARARVTRLLAALPGLLGAVTLGEYVTTRVAGIDNLFGFPQGTGPPVWPGRMAPTIAGCFVILAVGVVLPTLRREWPAQALALASLTLSLTAIVGHLYGAQALYRVSAYKGMPLQVALLLSVAGAGVLLAR